MGLELKGVFGSMDDVFLLVFVVIMGITGIFAYSIGLPNVLSLHMTDVNSISESATYGDYMENDFIPQALNLSEQKAAKQLGEEGGNVDWTRSNIPFSDVEDEMSGPYSSKMEQILGNYIEEANGAIRCSVASDYSIDSTSDSTTATDADAVVRCSNSNTMTEYNLRDDISSPLSTHYYRLGENFHMLAEEAKEELPDEKKTGTGSASSGCVTDGSIDKSSVNDDAESNARDNALPDLDSLPGNVRDDVDLHENVSYVSGSISYSPGSGDAVKQSSDTDDCDDPVPCDDPEEEGCTEPGDEYEATYKYTLDTIEVSYTLRDIEEKMLTSEGAENIVFSATYEHGLD